MEELYLPVLSHFQNGNGWTGSNGLLRYRVTPTDEGLSAQVWEGPWCYALSRVEEQQSFPLEEEGLCALRAWIGLWQENMASRHPKTLEETLAARSTAEG